MSSLVDQLNDSTLLPQLLQERADDGLIVHGPVVMWVEEQAERRFARAVRVPVAARS